MAKGLEIDANGDQKILIKAIDGYVVALDSKEILIDNNVYLVYKRDDEFLKDRDNGGDGPYQLIITTDEFSQRWCKNIVEIEIDG